jgi:hypothetical protein
MVLVPDPRNQTTKRTECECSFINRMKLIDSVAGSSIRESLTGKRLCPGVEYRLFPKSEDRSDGISASEYVENSGVSIEHQRSVLESLSKAPLSGYCFVGPTGTGKTFLMFALAKEAAYAGRTVVIRKAHKYIDACRSDIVAKDTEEPNDDGIYWNLLPKSSLPVHIYLDEIDSVSVTDFSVRTLFSFFDYCYENADKVVLTVSSNVGLNAWAKSFGDASRRRIEFLTTVINLGAKNDKKC